MINIITSFFAGITAKVAAFFAVLSGVFFMVIRYQSNKNDRLEHENETIHKKIEMQDSQSTFVAKVLADEQDELLKMTKEVNSNDKKPSLDDINNL